MTKPALYLFVGYPGSGKTTAAQIIERATGAVHLWADQERHKRFDNPSHSNSESTELYEGLNERTAELLRQGQSVIFDTNFNHFKDREKLRNIAANCNAETVLIWINTPLDLAKYRATGSDAPIRNGYKKPMTYEEFDLIAQKLEPPSAIENPINIDGTDLVESEVLSKIAIN